MPLAIQPRGYLVILSVPGTPHIVSTYLNLHRTGSMIGIYAFQLCFRCKPPLRAGRLTFSACVAGLRDRFGISPSLQEHNSSAGPDGQSERRR